MLPAHLVVSAPDGTLRLRGIDYRSQVRAIDVWTAAQGHFPVADVVDHAMMTDVVARCSRLCLSRVS